ncbi:hypothetical protein GIB67_034056 [Kingdonia uniflora]|uniref:Legume lectin domain-containing protein n=1 Tax=Kingdonia uniflora TaxID=39325 RepID=A0A7J7M661_9MAGN|nr:hypothetical protein GIB67_034056 [Kingdonia uniflora]
MPGFVRLVLYLLSSSIPASGLPKISFSNDKTSHSPTKTVRLVLYLLPSSIPASVIASFNTSFDVNIYRHINTTPGEGLAFIIAPDLDIPAQSYGQYLGLTNVSTDGNWRNNLIVIELDTVKQEFDPDDNHMGLNINSIKSNKVISLASQGMKNGTSWGLEGESEVEHGFGGFSLGEPKEMLNSVVVVEIEHVNLGILVVVIIVIRVLKLKLGFVKMEGEEEDLRNPSLPFTLTN